MTCETADAKAASEASHSFIHKSFATVKIFDPTLQLVHDSWTFVLPKALATILNLLIAYCFVLTERGAQRLKCALDHGGILKRNRGKSKMSTGQSKMSNGKKHINGLNCYVNIEFVGCLKMAWHVQLGKGNILRCVRQRINFITKRSRFFCQRIRLFIFYSIQNT